MLKTNKIYTKTGDTGSTNLLGNTRLCKSAARIEVLGTVDELNCNFGMIYANLNNQKELSISITRIQHDLFNLGGEIASHNNKIPQNMKTITQQTVEQLEQEIDSMETTLPTLSSFILPQGSTIIAQLHITRSVCRRAERRVVELHQTEPLSADILKYLNRLSDWLFVTARYINFKTKQTETLWQNQSGKENAKK